MKLLMTLAVSSLSLFTISTAKAQIDETIYDKCVNSQSTFNNSVVLSCSDKASHTYKKSMTHSYNKIYSALTKANQKDATKFEQSQIAWIEYRDKYCDLTGWYIGTPMYGLCPMTLNLQRAIELEEMARNF